MKNIYLTSSELKWRELLKYYCISFLIGIFSVILGINNIINHGSEQIFITTYSFAIILVFIQLINSKLCKCIIDEINFRTGSAIAIIIPILVAIVTRFVSDILQGLPTLF